MKRAARGLLAALALAAWLPAFAEAQRPGRRGQGMQQNREQMMQRIRQRFAQMIREELDLSEDRAERLGEVIRDFDEQRRSLSREEQAVRRRVEALMLEGGDDQTEAQELLARMVELREDEARVFAAEQAALSEVLEPVQVLRLMILRDQMAQRIRALRGGGTGRRQGGPGQER